MAIKREGYINKQNFKLISATCIEPDRSTLANSNDTKKLENGSTVHVRGKERSEKKRKDFVAGCVRTDLKRIKSAMQRHPKPAEKKRKK